MKPFVFLGPSLPLADAQAILDAVYLPPVSMGDIYRLMARKPTVIAIVDGLFEQTPAVWHKHEYENTHDTPQRYVPSLHTYPRLASHNRLTLSQCLRQPSCLVSATHPCYRP